MTTTLTPGLQNSLPNPLYVGNAITDFEQFAQPTFGVPQDQWPLTDPSSLTLTITDPSGTVVVWTYGGAGNIIRLQTGIYSAEVATSSPGPGRWTLVWEGTGACAAIGKHEFTTVAP